VIKKPQHQLQQQSNPKPSSQHTSIPCFPTQLLL